MPVGRPERDRTSDRWIKSPIRACIRVSWCEAECRSVLGLSLHRPPSEVEWDSAAPRMWGR